MKRILPYCLLVTFLSVVSIQTSAQCIRETVCEFCVQNVPDSLIVSDPAALFNSMPQPVVDNKKLNLSFSPKVFSGYQEIQEIPTWSKQPIKYRIKRLRTRFINSNDTTTIEETEVQEEVTVPDSVSSMPSLLSYETPEWLQNAWSTAASQESLLYSYMIANPLSIEKAYWDLPVPPVLLKDDRSYMAFINQQKVPEATAADAKVEEVVIKKRHWLHTVNAALQFSQAFVSPNWYQGGNNYLALLFNFNWNVQLNQVYHPNILFQSDLTYKMALSSNPSGYMHKYTIAEDNFQYNLNAGYKAAKNWYYSFNLQFKTQLLNNYEQDSDTRTAAFLSPGDLNLGLGMAYSRKNKLNTFQYTLTISPLSYNLKTCISNKVDHLTYSIPVDKKSKSEIGSNLEFNMDWKITPNISYKTRVFMFTDYKYYLADWQNTLSFEINKFLSTQIFVHLRYDGSTESDSKWKKFMLREILSFGLSYTFATKI